MVLQSNYAKRVASNAENKRPAPINSTAMRHKRSAALRHRTRTDTKHTVEQAAARQSRTKAAKFFNFKLKTVVPRPIRDVEMADATPQASSSSTTYKPVSVTLPRELEKPNFPEVSREALLAVDPGLTDVDAAYLRDNLEFLGPTFYQTLTQVETPPQQAQFPKEVEITVNNWEPNFVFPTHILAVFGPDHSPGCSVKDKVMLYPVHSLYLAAHCSRLPPMPTVEQKYEFVGEKKVTSTIPVHAIRLPSPVSYKRLFAYIYTKRADGLLSSLLPMSPPTELMHALLPVSRPDIKPWTAFFQNRPDPYAADPSTSTSTSHHKPKTQQCDSCGKVVPPTATTPATAATKEQKPTEAPFNLSPEEARAVLHRERRKAIMICATRLAATYALQALMQHLLCVHGLYLNVCALGISDEGLWEATECAWEILLTAIAVSSGKPLETVLGADESLPSSST